MSSGGPRIVTGAVERRSRWRWVIGGFVLGGVLGALFSPLKEAVLPSATLHRVAQLEEERDQLRQALAVAQRGEQVTRRSLDELREQLTAMEAESAGLAEELSFYESMVAEAGNDRGLNVHSLQIQPTETPMVFEFRLVLGQRLRRARPISGSVDWTVTGMQAEELVRLDAESLRIDAAKQFEFKYFQELRGELQLPQGFTPQFIEIQLQADGGTSARQRMNWEEALNP